MRQMRLGEPRIEHTQHLCRVGRRGHGKISRDEAAMRIREVVGVK